MYVRTYVYAAVLLGCILRNARPVKKNIRTLYISVVNTNKEDVVGLKLIFFLFKMEKENLEKKVSLTGSALIVIYHG